MVLEVNLGLQLIRLVEGASLGTRSLLHDREGRTYLLNGVGAMYEFRLPLPV